MLVMDCGKNTATIYNSETDSCITVSHQQVLEYDFPRDSLVVGENAHFGTERTDRSLSQPFTADELTQWYSRLQNAGVILKLFPEQSTPLAIQHSGLSKSDENDPKSIFLYLKDNAHLIVTLKNPPVTFAEDPIRIEGYQKKDDLNIQLNKARRHGYKDPKDKLTKWIYDNIEDIAEHLSPAALDAFGLVTRCSTGKRKGQFMKISIAQIYTVAATMMNQKGELKTRKNGQLVGWEFVRRHLIPMSSFHRKGGVGRSNIFHHGAKNYIARKMDNKVENDNGRKVVKRRENFSAEEKQAFIFYRNTYCKCVRELFQVLKKNLVAVHTSF